jgi:hypothetical protein
LRGGAESCSELARCEMNEDLRAPDTDLELDEGAGVDGPVEPREKLRWRSAIFDATPVPSFMRFGTDIVSFCC